MDGLDPATRQTIVAEVSEAIAPRLCSPDDVWTMDYVRLRFLAIKRSPAPQPHGKNCLSSP